MGRYAIVLAFASTIVCRGADERFSAECKACLAEAEGQTTLGMVRCIEAERKLEDARLNRAYQKLIAQETPERLTDLRNVQTAWLGYMTAKCQFTPYPGGTMSTIWSSSCRLHAVRQRADELEQFHEH